MIVVDTETTGLGDQDQVIEFAAVWPGGNVHFLVRPTVPVSVEARAEHHISDEMLSGCADAAGWLATLVEVFAEHPGPVVAHNVEFDLRMIRQTWPTLWSALPPVICTYRCSLHLWPEAPKHTNQVLRYWLGVEPAVKTHLAPHRALPDAAVTYSILQEMLKKREEQELVVLTGEPVLLRKVRFGKYLGEEWKDVPKDYLKWIIRSGDFDRDVLHTARYYYG